MIRNICIFIALQCFVSATLAAPAEQSVLIDSNIESSTPENKNYETTQSNPKLETLSYPINSKETATAQPIDHTVKKNSEVFYKYEQSVTVRMGWAADIKEINAVTNVDKEYPFTFGFKYMLPSKTYKYIEIGVDYNTQPKIYLSGIYRFIFMRTEKLRPTAGVGLSIRFDEGDKFETPFVLGSYQIVANMGLENFLKNTKSVRADIDVHYGTKDFLALLSIGYSWGI